ncbi:MAG: dienelactone hydrolase family protein [Mariniphaga sp.]|nr:dienelactone hydrolase family protein [Mariniphaga sp.]
MEKKISKLYGDYITGKIERRSFVKKLSMVFGGTVAISTFLPLFEVNYLKAAEKINAEELLFIEQITFKGETGEMKAFLARPKEKKRYPAVIVIHENKGLQPHIKNVNKRMAMEGFLAIAPDALSPMGGTPDNDVDLARTRMRELDMEKTIKNFTAAVKYLKTHPLSTGKVGCTGFCWGGAMTNKVAVNAPNLDAAVPYYGSQPAKEDVLKIKAPVLAHYAGDDARINKGIDAFKEALKAAGVEHQTFIYEGAKHAFNNDSNPERYHEEAAKLAWKRTIDFFKEKLDS